MKTLILSLLMMLNTGFAAQYRCQDVVTIPGNGVYKMVSAGFSVFIDKKYSYLDQFEDSLTIVFMNGTLAITKFYKTQDWAKAQAYYSDEFRDAVYGGHPPKNYNKVTVLKSSSEPLNGLPSVMKEYTYMSGDDKMKGTLIILKTSTGVYQIKFELNENNYDETIARALEIVKTIKPITEK
ncbi:MAG: hypothetical protein HPY53_00860 [Brevinematales bacterium]|nr:hypothetical protein [Brevinematales bacterium]